MRINYKQAGENYKMERFLVGSFAREIKSKVQSMTPSCVPIFVCTHSSLFHCLYLSAWCFGI